MINIIKITNIITYRRKSIISIHFRLKGIFFNTYRSKYYEIQLWTDDQYSFWNVKPIVYLKTH